MKFRLFLWKQTGHSKCVKMCCTISKLCASQSLPGKEICTYSLGGEAVKITCTPVPRNTNCAESKKYNPTCLLSFMLKIILEFLTRNIRGESLGYVPYIYTNLPTN
jgi:hypothetical protein